VTADIPLDIGTVAGEGAVLGVVVAAVNSAVVFYKIKCHQYLHICDFRIRIVFLLEGQNNFEKPLMF
jgi:hypothetical protein